MNDKQVKRAPHTEESRKRLHNVKAKDKACPVCRGLRYKIDGARCTGCGRNKDTKFCPACGGMPERVSGVAGSQCLECGTVAGKNLEYRF